MVRTYKMKSERCNISEEAVKIAIIDVIKYNKSVREAATNHGLSKSMLHKRIQQFKKKKTDNACASDSGNSSEEDIIKLSLKVSGRNKFKGQQIFTDEEERMLCEYFIKASEIHYGLTYMQARKLAFEYCVKLGKPMPESWVTNGTAGTDWMLSFMKRNPNVSLRRPENTSLARALSFNMTNVKTFYDNYGNVLERYNFDPDRILNLDETGVTTVLPSPKVIAPTGKKQVGQIVSRERGELVTMCGIIKATGNTIPPVFVFPRVKYQENFLIGAPAGSLGLATKSGWMTAELFPSVLQHIQKHTQCSKENPVLILLDNHSSHITIEAMDYARDNGIVILSFPPHCSHRLQPLDVSVFGPFKAALKVAFSDWLRTNPGKQISIYNIPTLAASAFVNSFIPKNIISGFAKPGIYPFNRLVFTDDDFLCNYVCDRSNPATKPSGPLKNPESPTPSTSQQINQSTPASSTLHDTVRTMEEPVTPEDVRPLPKVTTSGNGTKRKREQMKSCIYTDTPEKRKLEEKAVFKKATRKTKTVEDMGNQSSKHLKRQLFKKVVREDSSSYETDEAFELSSGDEFSESSELPQPAKLCDSDIITVNDFVLVQFEAKNKILCYAALVTEMFDTNEYCVKYLRKKRERFTFPAVEDIAAIERKDIVCELPTPKVTAGTKRTAGYMWFEVDLSTYNVL